MSDPALSARVLKFANSPLLRTPARRIRARGGAVLGLRTVREYRPGLFLASQLCPLPGIRPATLLARQLPDRGDRPPFANILVLPIARRPSPRQRRIGQLAFAHALPTNTAKSCAGRRGPALVEAERKILGTDHTQLGTRILTEWGLPTCWYGPWNEQADRPRPDSQEDAAAHIVHLAAGVAGILPQRPLERASPAGGTSRNRGDVGPGRAPSGRTWPAPFAPVRGPRFSSTSTSGAACGSTTLRRRPGDRASRPGAYVGGDAHRLRRAMTDRLTGVASQACLNCGWLNYSGPVAPAASPCSLLRSTVRAARQ